MTIRSSLITAVPDVSLRDEEVCHVMFKKVRKDEQEVLAAVLLQLA
jgi:hypothetical protein